MGKIKSTGGNLSLKTSLMLYIVIFAMVIFVLLTVTFLLCSTLASDIRASYPISGEKYYLTNEKGEQLGDGVFIDESPVEMTKRGEIMIVLLELIPIIAAPVYSALCIIAAVLLFYRNKLKKPLAQLRTASEKISNHDLNFSIQYDSKDELGQLCRSFEIMRAALADNFSEMCRQVEERGQLNAAFAHDLRTPLTVLKGYNEILQSSDDSRTRETAQTMERHISRMEKYVGTMSNLQRLEDTYPEYRTILLQPFLTAVYESAEMVCMQNGKTLYLKNNTTVPQVSIDTEFVSQVSNNLIANAVRYAHKSITLSFEQHHNGLAISVSDDGKGFDKNVLHKAACPYFTKETGSADHFGLGLYICKLLCEHHGGSLRIENGSGGGKVTAFFKTPVL